MTMVERVARAIEEKLDEWAAHKGIVWNDDETEVIKGEFRFDGYVRTAELARAAIVAMREPNDAMADAWTTAIDAWLDEEGDNDGPYKAMIDAALKEEEQ